MFDHLHSAAKANLVSEVLSDHQPPVNDVSHDLPLNKSKITTTDHLTKHNAVFTINDLLILPGKISHTRFFPAFHAFKYSYLMVGIPLHSTQGNWLVSVDEQSWWKRGWLRIEADDHLGRGQNEGGIRRKLDLYLESQGANPADYPKVYLITSPRLLYQNFSPASFWYLYSSDEKLKAMVVEVNNTFDERRMYFLPSNMDQADDLREDDNQSMKQDLSDSGSPSRRFKYSWSKDFHVSPFNSRKGSYTLSACDPSLSEVPSRTTSGKDKPFVDIKAGLLSSKGRPKMHVRLWSTDTPLSPATISIWRAVVFLCSWFWLGWMTFPSIVFEAIKLAHRKKLSIWYRPEVRQSTIARKATTEEIFLADVFHKYLSHLINHVKAPFRLNYNSIAREVQQCTLVAPSQNHETATDPPPTKEFRVLTPLFYSRLCSYPSLDAALTAEVISTEAEENRTAQITDESSELYALLVDANNDSEKGQHPQRQPESFPDRLSWRTVYLLRQDPAKGLYPSPGLPKSRLKGVIKAAKTGELDQLISPITTPNFLDVFVRDHCSRGEQREYRRTLVRLFLANRVAFGSVEVLWMYRLVLQGLVGFSAAWMFSGKGGWTWYAITTAAVCLGLGQLKGMIL